MRSALIMLIGLVIILALAAAFTILDQVLFKRGWMKHPKNFLYYLLFCSVIVAGNVIVFIFPSLSPYRYIFPAFCLFIFLVVMNWYRRSP